MRVSIIIPVLNDYQALSQLLLSLQALPEDMETIVVDGGSTDGSVMVAKQMADQVLEAPKGRAKQQNAGAKIAQGEVLWFVHADSQLDKLSDYFPALNHPWGRFAVKIQAHRKRLAFATIGWFMNTRACLTGVATGDQGIFVQKELFEQVGGFPDIALMEDIALSKQLKRHSRPYCAKPILVTSGRKWEQEGVLRTMFLMWWLRIQYFFGVSPDTLVRQYYR